MSRLVLLAFIFAFPLWAQAQAFCVNKSGTKLYSQASTKAAVSWKVPKHMPLFGTGKKQKGMVEVNDVDGQLHWVKRSELSSRSNCVVVKTNSTVMRSGPGKKFEPVYLGVVDRYAAFEDLGGEDGWTQVQDETGMKAWINLDHTWKPTKKYRMSFNQ